MVFAEINSHELLWCELAAEPISNFYLNADTETYAVHPQLVKVFHGLTLKIPETVEFVQTPENIQFFRTFHIKPLVYGGLLNSTAVPIRVDRKLYPHTLDTQVQVMALHLLAQRYLNAELQTTLFEGVESSYTWLHVLKPLAHLFQAMEQEINLLKASKLWADLGTIESMGGPSKLFFNDFLWNDIVVIRPSELREVIRPFKE